MGTQDNVTLSARERQQIASMQASLEAADPELAKILRRQKAPQRDSWGRAFGRGRSRLLADLTAAWVGPAAVLAGLHWSS